MLNFFFFFFPFSFIFYNILWFWTNLTRWHIFYNLESKKELNKNCEGFVALFRLKSATWYLGIKESPTALQDRWKIRQNLWYFQVLIWKRDMTARLLDPMGVKTGPIMPPPLSSICIHYYSWPRFSLFLIMVRTLQLAYIKPNVFLSR